MVVLVVDDQINIVNGIYVGVNWNRIGVTKVLKAYNTFEAKEILKPYC
jgi:two-component system response regulator YesN